MSDIEEQIRQAMEEGKFADLPGTGAPLRLEENPYVDPEWQLAYHMLRSNGFTLPWIERRRDIEAEMEAARQDLRRSFAWREVALSRQSVLPDFIEAEWRKACTVFKERIAAINEDIRSYNLGTPSERFQLRVVSAERELELTAANPSVTLTTTDPE